MHDHPLVVPGREPARRVEDLGCGRPFGPQFIDGPVMEKQEGRVHTGEDDVLVVPRVPQQRPARGVTRNILEQAAAPTLSLAGSAGS